MFSSNRQAHRRVFIEAWRKASTSSPLEPLEQQIVEILTRHPEYHRILEQGDSACEQEFHADRGETNPFMHLGMHLAIAEQLSLDRPSGIRQLYQRLVARTGDAHEAEHRIMGCLAEALWELQRSRTPFEERGYLACIQRLTER